MITILPAGESAVLVEYDELPSVLGNFRALDASRIPGVIDLIPAARTILIKYDNTITAHQLVEKWYVGPYRSNSQQTRAGLLSRFRSATTAPIS